MKVVYSNGKEGTLSAKESENLYTRNRFTKEEWEELEKEMIKLDIVQFDDPLLSALGADMVHIDYVRNQIAAH